MKLKVNEISKIRNLQDLKHYVEDNNRVLKKFLLVAVVVFALLIFWIFGGKGDVTVKAGETDGNIHNGAGENNSNSSETDASLKNNFSIYVDIGGEVNNPGVYEVSDGTRLFQVIEKAGGLSANANTDAINQAETVFDGQKIIIGSNEKSSPYYVASAEGSYSYQGANPDNNAKVNINSGDSIELQTIPGVGPSTAKKIIEYRETYGFFSSIEEIKNVSGIGEKTFESMKEYITV